MYVVPYIEHRMSQCTCTVGWVNFSEFEITVCGSCKMSKKTKLTIFYLKKKFICENPYLFFHPLHSKK